MSNSHTVAAVQTVKFFASIVAVIATAVGYLMLLNRVVGLSPDHSMEAFFATLLVFLVIGVYRSELKFAQRKDTI